MIQNPYQYFRTLIPAPTSKVPQNVISVIKELGENSVVFFLFLITRNTSWKVYRNLSEIGCDIILSKNKRLIKIEVKTRQSLHSTSKNFQRNGQNHKKVQFELTKLEYQSCDIIIGFWFDRNAYFILEKYQLVPSTSKNNKYRILIDEKIDKQTKQVSYHYGKKNNRKMILPNNWKDLKNKL